MRPLKHVPIRLRLTLIYGVWMAVLLPCVGLGLFSLVERNLLQSVDAALSASAQSMQDKRSTIGGAASVIDDLLNGFFGERQISASAQIIDLSGRVYSRSVRTDVSLPFTRLAMARAERGDATFESFARASKAPFRLLTVPIMFQGHFTGDIVQVGAPLDSTYQALREISTVLWIGFPVMLAMTLGFGFLLTRGSFRPVVDIQKAAATMGAKDLSKRLPLPDADDELKLLTITFNEMLDRLEDAFERLRRFSADVSHELRTPLAAIRAEAELALRRERSSTDYQSALGVVAKESIHMSSIVEDLLLLAKAESRSVILSPAEISSDGFLDEVKLGLKSYFQEKNVDLIISNAAPKMVTFSVGYVSLALRNLLTNAAKHARPGTSVELSLEADKDFLIWHVRDHGDGISEDDLKKIFDPFYRVDSVRNREVGGAGIGLSLAQALARLHGGDITATSVIGEGSEFVLRIQTPPS